MKNIVGKLKAALVVALSVAVTSCGDSATVNKQPGSGQALDEIIGGVDASGKSLDAVGTIGTVNSAGKFDFFCTATLISPTVVLTAKHCAVVLDGIFAGMKYVNLIPIYFAVGADSKKPTQLVEAIAADLSPVNTGGFVSLGNDVAVYHLSKPITDVTPIAVASKPLADADIGKVYASVGYGVQSNYENGTGRLAATRKAGSSTMRALKGKSFEAMFGSYEGFRERMVEIYGEEIVKEFEDIIQAWYDETLILENYEAWTGAAPGDAQTCFGDSGGPLLGKADGKRQIYGVVSGGMSSSQLACDYGTFYSTIGEKTAAMITKAYDYKDPCADTSVNGECSGTVATRCSGKWEGDRRKLVTDCALIDQVCSKNAAGQVGCFDKDQGGGTGGGAGGGTGGGTGGGSASDGGTPGGQQNTPPTIEEIRQMIMKASRLNHSLAPK